MLRSSAWQKRRLCQPDTFVIPTFFVIPTKEGSAIHAKTISSNESIFIDSYLLGSLLRQPLRCFVPQHDKNDAFAIPALLSSRRFCHPDEGGICEPCKNNFKQRIYIHWSILLGSLCASRSDASFLSMTKPTPLSSRRSLSSRRRRDLRSMQKQFQATNLYSLIAIY